MANQSLVRAREHLARMQQHVRNLKGKGEEAVGEAMATAEVFGGAVAGGFIDEHFGVIGTDGVKLHEIDGIPTTLLLGMAGKAAAFFELAGKHSHHVHDVANGMLCSYGVNIGRSLARKAAATV